MPKIRHDQVDIISRSRATVAEGYMVIPKVNRCNSVLPQFENVEAFVLATPDIGAKFIEHELVFAADGRTRSCINDPFEHFLYVLEGGVKLTIGEKTRHEFTEGGYAYLPPGTTFSLENTGAEESRMLWLKHRFMPWEDLAPKLYIGSEKDVTSRPGQPLLPFADDLAYDLGMLIVNVEPGRGISQVETHIMEHGLYMLDGQGLYWLNGAYHEVMKDDFIYFARYCPQYFYVTGESTGRYLLYKDVNRDYDDML